MSNPPTIPTLSTLPDLPAARLPPAGALLELPHLGLIRVRGADAETFLQGQLSNDLRQLRADQVQLHAYCNPKGRALGLFYVMRAAKSPGDDFWLVTVKALGESLLTRLKMYVMRADVTLAFATDWVLAGSYNYSSSDTVAPPDAAVYHLTPPRQFIIAPRAAITPIVHIHLAADYWRLCDILAGIPQIYPQTTAMFIPQYINLDRIFGVSFNKGCYAGQEIIARLRYLGKTKQRLMVGRVAMPPATALAPGDPIYAVNAANATDGAPKAGLVVDAVQTAPARYEVALTAPVTMHTHGDLAIGAPDGPLLTRLPLPYAIDDAGAPVASE